MTRRTDLPEPGEGEVPAVVDDEERALAWLLLERGAVGPDALRTARDDSSQTRDAGSPMTIGQILVKRRLLDSQELLSALREQRRLAVDCPGCARTWFRLGRRPVAVDCPGCGTELPAPAAFESTQVERDRPVALRERFGKYEVVREVGVGGMGLVYEAIDPVLRRRVALKVLRRAGPDGKRAQRLLREAQSAAQLSHPGIVRIHEVGSVPGRDGGEPTDYIAMDFVDGTTLAPAMAARDLPDRVRLVEQVAHAIAHAHARGVVHRDLKPDNVFVDPEGRPIVGDFGLAIWDSGATRLTRTGAAVGTPHYMAPEQVEAGREVGSPADVWALGVILYEALTGRRPFEAETSAALFRAILHADPVGPRKVDRRVARDLEAICLKALERDPRRRYADAGGLAADLARWLGGEVVLATHAPWASRTVRRIRRNPWAWGGALAAVLAIAGASGSIGLVLRRADERARSDRLAHEAALAYAIGDVPKAREKAAEALEAFPENAEASYWLARCDLRDYQARLGMPEVRVSGGLTEVVPPRPETEAERRLRVRIEAALGSHADSALVRGILSMWAGRYEEARRELARVPADSVGGWEARLWIAACAYCERRFEEAHRILEPYESREEPIVQRLRGEIALALGIEDRLAGRDPEARLRTALTLGRWLMDRGLDGPGRLLRARALAERAEWALERGGDPEPLVEEGLAEVEEGSPEVHVARGDLLLARARHRANRGRIDLDRPQEYEEAILAYGRAIDLDPEYGTARVRRAQAHLARHEWQRSNFRADPADLEAARADLRAALATPAGGVEARTALAAVEGALERGDGHDAGRVLASRRREVETLEAIVAEHPDHAPALRRLGESTMALALATSDYRERERLLGEAAGRLRQSVEVHPGYRDALASLALIQEEIGRVRVDLEADPFPAYREGLETLAEVERLDPTRSQTFERRARFYREMALHEPDPARREEYYEQGIAAATDAIRLQPTWASHYLTRGYIRRDQGGDLLRRGLPSRECLRLAVEDLRAALAVNPNLFDAYRVLAMVRQRLAAARAAAGEDPLPELLAGVEDCRRGLASNPRAASAFPAMHVALASLLLEIGEERSLGGADPILDFEAAVEALDDAAALRPRDVDVIRVRARAHRALGSALARAGRDPEPSYAAAIADFTLALELVPTHPFATQWLFGRAELRVAIAASSAPGEGALSLAEAALADLQTVLERAPDDVPSLALAGQALLVAAESQTRRGRPAERRRALEEAARRFERAIEIDPGARSQLAPLLERARRG